MSSVLEIFSKLFQGEDSPRKRYKERVEEETRQEELLPKLKERRSFLTSRANQLLQTNPFISEAEVQATDLGNIFREMRGLDERIGQFESGVKARTKVPRATGKPEYGLQGPITPLRARLESLGIDTRNLSEQQLEILTQNIDPRLAAEFGLGPFRQPTSIDASAVLNPRMLEFQEQSNPFEGYSGAELQRAFEAAAPDTEAMRERAVNTKDEKLANVFGGLAAGAAQALRPGSGGVGAVLAAAGAKAMDSIQRLNEIEDEKLDKIGLLEAKNAREAILFNADLAMKAAAIEEANLQRALQIEQINQQNQMRAAELALQVGTQQIETPYGVTRFQVRGDGQVVQENIPDYYKINRLIDEDQRRRALVDAQLGRLDYLDTDSSKIYLRHVLPEKRINFHIARGLVQGTYSNSLAIRQLALESLPESEQEKLEVSALTEPEETEQIINNLVFKYVMSQPDDILLQYLTPEERDSLGTVIQSDYGSALRGQ